MPPRAELSCVALWVTPVGRRAQASLLSTTLMMVAATALNDATLQLSYPRYSSHLLSEAMAALATCR